MSCIEQDGQDWREVRDLSPGFLMPPLITHH
jgi:hypothetical protein